MTWPSYNLHELIDEVVNLLRQKGIAVSVDPVDQDRREGGAAALLSGLHVIPTVSSEHALDLDGHAQYNRDK